MSRYELAELEAELRIMADGGDDQEDELTPAQLEAEKNDPGYPKML